MRVRFVRVEAPVEGGLPGYLLDPQRYLSELSQFQAALSEGARRFALDEDHYDFHGLRCVKDLKLDEVRMTDRSDRVQLEIRFAPNQFKHDQGPVLRYTDVAEFSASVTAGARAEHVWPESRRLGDVQLDEILPHAHGCSHEIQMTGGSMWIVAGDLIHEWVDPA